MGGGDKGAQTVFPGSTHSSGETIEWNEKGEPSRSSYAALESAVTKIAVGTILVRAWPDAGSRHDASLALGGFLARVGWETDDIGYFVEVIAGEAESEDDSTDRGKAATDAAEAHARGDHVYGFPGLSQYFGEKPATHIAKLLKYRKATQLTAAARGLTWRESDKNGHPIASLHNARIAVTALNVECRHDLFHDKILIGYCNSEIQHEVRELVGEVTDHALLRLRLTASDRFGFDPKPEYIHDAVRSLALEHCFDPVLELLDAAQSVWDKKPRLDRWVVDYLGCEDTPLNRAIGRRKSSSAAARRARVPGSKFDPTSLFSKALRVRTRAPQFVT